MPWAKPKPLGAYLGVYRTGLDFLAQAGFTGASASPWIDLLMAEDEATAERIVVQGRAWAREATRQALHPVLRTVRPSFRRQGPRVQMRLTPRLDERAKATAEATAQVVLAEAIDRAGLARPGSVKT